ncbi:hypothetical protein [Nocardia nova]|uniref:hypothetical protein n=1 Tax=Nocardia nova TaxID=37330 RepID=UPI0015E29EF5|nr:hypothetical protein [Nocardia nova]
MVEFLLFAPGREGLRFGLGHRRGNDSPTELAQIRHAAPFAVNCDATIRPTTPTA